ncbi:hypothetical protein GQ44DRAFT_731924 [Phaeosphaeriaceae sp. PMI808]|nr:hypothetical protein GQ44DRAFT_731924 [Phaeosphaeriaceae sp. PMI808]
MAILWAQPTHVSAIRLAIEVKLLQAMNDISEAGATSYDIPAKCDKQVDVLVGRIFCHLTAMGTVRAVGPDTFVPTPTSKAFANSSYEDAILYIKDNFQPALQAVRAYFQRHGFTSLDCDDDTTFHHAYNCKDTSYFEYFAKFSPEMGRRFASMMDVWSKGRPRWFLEEYYPVQERLIDGAEQDRPFLVGIGGGSGHDIEGLRQAFEGRLLGKLVLQDRPEIVELAKFGLGAGAIVPSMAKGYSKVLVNDFVVPNQDVHWKQTCLDWELMASLGVWHRTEAEHKKLYERAGLKVIGIWGRPTSADSLIELELV